MEILSAFTANFFPIVSLVIALILFKKGHIAGAKTVLIIFLIIKIVAELAYFAEFLGTNTSALNTANVIDIIIAICIFAFGFYKISIHKSDNKSTEEKNASAFHKETTEIIDNCHVDNNKNTHFISSIPTQPMKKYVDQRNSNKKTAGVVFCRKCGSRLQADSVFCNKCGTKIIR